MSDEATTSAISLGDVLAPISPLPVAEPGVRQVVIIGAARFLSSRPPKRGPWRDAQLTRLTGLGDDELHDRLARLPRVDVVIDARRAREARQLQSWRELFLHLDDGASWVTLRGPGAVEELVARIAELGRRRTGLADAIGDVRVGEQSVTIVKRGRHLLKLRDQDALGLLPSREPDLGVTLVGRRAGGTFTPAGTTTSYSGHDPGFDETFAYPELQIRRYEGTVVLPRTTFMFHGRSALPESFRWHLTPSPRTSGLRDIRERFGLLEDPGTPAEPLTGSYYHFGYNNPGHFGHLMTEAIARLWGWREAKAADPELKILCRVHPNPERTRPPERYLEALLLPAFGIDLEDIVWVDRPTSVESIVGVTPMWHNAPPYHAHPDIREVWAALRSGLARGESGGPERIFVTRPQGLKRPCRNAPDVERLFSERGYFVVEPSRLPVPEQAALFAGARVIAGFGGSGMFNMVYARDVRNVIVLNHTGYIARNEHLFASLFGADSHFFWSDPDLEHPQGDFSRKAFMSSWTFDMERNRDALTRLLDRLAG